MELPKHYSLHSEKDDHFVLHDKRDGKTFKVAKKSIHPAHQIRIMKMQKLNEGGDVEAPEDQISNPEVDFFNNPQVSQSNQGALEGLKSGLMGVPGAIRSLWHYEAPKGPEVPPMSMPQQAPMPQDDTSQAAQIVAQDMAGGQAPAQQAATQQMAPQRSLLAGTPYEGAFKMMESGIANKAAAEAQGFQAQQQAIQDNMEQMRQFNMTSQQEAWNKRVELDNMMDEMKSQKIDPNRLWASRDRGSRVLAGLSLILGGIGAGLTHGPNLALEQMNRLVDQDIDAQKTDINNKHTLYNMNLKRYGDQLMADQSTRLQMNQMMQFQVQAAMAKANSAGAMAAGQQMLGQLKMQQADTAMKFGVLMAKHKIMGAGTGEGGIPVVAEPAQLLDDEKYLEKRVVVNGKAYQAASPKEGEELRTTMAKITPIERDINLLRSLGPEALLDPAKHQLVEGLVGRLSMNVNEFNGYKRFTDVDDKVIQKQFNNPATVKALLAGNESNVDTLKALRLKMNESLRNGLVNYREGQADTFQPSNSGKLPLNKGK